MMTVKKLLNACKDRKLGNHRVRIATDMKNAVIGRAFIYHQTTICMVDDRNKLFIVDDGGWKTQSTKRAINAYRKELSNLGYAEVV